MRTITLPLIALTALVGFSSPALAQDDTDLSLSAGCTQKSQYLGSNGDVFDTDPSTQCYGRVTTPDGFYADIWVAEDFDGNPDFGNEWDFTFGKAGSSGSINYEVAIAYYALVNSGDVVNAIAVVSTDVTIDEGTLSPYIRVDGYFSPQNNGPQSGVITRLGANYSLPLAEDWTFGAGGEVFYDTGSFGYESGLLGMARANISYAASDNVSVVVGGEIYTPLIDANTIRNTNAVATVGVHFSF